METYKGFDKDLKCRGFQFEIGKKYKQEGHIILCQNGFHSCEKLEQVFDYYPFDNENRFCEVEISGELDKSDEKISSSQIEILRELSKNEILELVNIGIDNTGIGNSGNRNSGDWNSGNWNSGNWNSGNWNSGYWNSGYSNSGNRNSGDSNSGYSNSGNRNSGDWNSGNWNSGNRNSGNWNSGNWNSGNWNSGNWNSGNKNSGNRNSGDWNSGYSNSGYSNSGNWNSGNWNSCNSETGYFNSKDDKYVRIFNKKCKKEVWENSIKPKFIYNIILTEWINFDKMTDEEKKNDPEAYFREGYLKKYTYNEAWRNAYDKATKEDIELLRALPNFNAKVFEEITGININN
jgi:hypothetical protein